MPRRFCWCVAFFILFLFSSEPYVVSPLSRMHGQLTGPFSRTGRTRQTSLAQNKTSSLDVAPPPPSADPLAPGTALFFILFNLFSSEPSFLSHAWATRWAILSNPSNLFAPATTPAPEM